MIYTSLTQSFHNMHATFLKRILALRAWFDLGYLTVTVSTVVLGRLTTLWQRDECKMLTIGKEASVVLAVFRLYAQRNKAFHCRNARSYLQESRKESKIGARKEVR
jgi:hypothetical protein